MEDINRLWALTGETLSDYPEDENHYYDPIGLILFKDICCWEYWCTPTNSLTFATTGGDGVHYGVLKIKGKEFDQSPVVMTLPSADEANIVIGENLREFLALGCRSGYFSLEQIAYQRENHIHFLESHEYENDADDSEQMNLKKIEATFNLHPPTNIKERLRELKEQYFELLEYSEEYYEIMD